MAGIGSMVKGGQDMPTGGQMAPAGGQPAMQPGPADGADEEPNVSPEEQEQYELVVRNALKVIYPEGEGEATVSPQVLQGLEGSENPTMNLATTAVTLVTSLRESAKQAGSGISDEVLFHAGQAIVEELAEVSEAAKIHDFSEEEIEQAWYAGLDMYRTSAEQSGDIDVDALKQGWGELVEADKQGRVGEFAPGLEERMRAAGQQEAG